MDDASAMSPRSLAPVVLVSVVGLVVLACGGHSAGQRSSGTTSGDAGAGDARAFGAVSARDASSTEDGPAAGDAGAMLDAAGPPEGGAPECAIPDAAKAFAGCTALSVACISVAIDCACSATEYQMLCQAMMAPPSALGCTSQPSISPEAPAYCCPCGSGDAGSAGN